ncbi:MAG: hypothetical protein K2M17_04100, partial [Bacilli bacterium]|nr:hypothetical protein [Bacilli bacterium]
MKRTNKKIKWGIFLAIATLFMIPTANAITSNDVTYDNNGTTESLTTSLDTLYSELKKYKTSGSVQANQMLKGATGYAMGQLVTGTIESKEATTYTPGTSNQTIAAGQYLSGVQTIKGDANLKAANIAKGKSIFGVSGTYTSDATATAAQILKDKIAYVNGAKVTGTMKNNSSKTVESTSVTQDTTYTYLKVPEAGYYDSNSQVKVLNNSIG